MLEEPHPFLAYQIIWKKYLLSNANVRSNEIHIYMERLYVNQINNSISFNLLKKLKEKTTSLYYVVSYSPHHTEFEIIVATTLNDRRVTHLHSRRVCPGQVFFLFNGLFHRLSQFAMPNFLEYVGIQ